MPILKILLQRKSLKCDNEKNVMSFCLFFGIHFQNSNKELRPDKNI